MGEVVLLEALVVQREVLVMEKVMSHVVHNVTENAAAEHGRSHVPVEEEQRMCQLPERPHKYQEEGRWHD